MTVDRNAFGFDTRIGEVLAGLDLSGKVALVTGASGGLGAVTARALAASGVHVTLAARDTTKAEAVVASIRQEVPDAALEVLELELSQPDSVRAAAKRWLASHSELNMLIGNAGIMACPLLRTAEGWEMQFATNHLGHFLLTNLLAPALVAGAPARVVSVSSGGHKGSPVVFDDIHFERREYDKWSAYGQSKTANIWLALEIDRRLADRGVRAFAIHPGAIPTELGRHLQREDHAALASRTKGRMVYKQPEAGAATQAWAATAPELDGKGGLYLEDCQIASPQQGDSLDGHAPWALDAEGAARLWSVSEEMLGEHFDP